MYLLAEQRDKDALALLLKIIFTERKFSKSINRAISLLQNLGQILASVANGDTLPNYKTG